MFYFKLINQQLTRLWTRVTATQEKEKKIYQKMFSQDKKAFGAKSEHEVGEDDDDEEDEEDDVSIFKICW